MRVNVSGGKTRNVRISDDLAERLDAIRDELGLWNSRDEMCRFILNNWALDHQHELTA